MTSANVETVELLPCPLCKRQPKRNGRIGVGGVVCTGDNATVGMIHRFQTYGADQAEADGAWNLAALSRPSPAPSEQSNGYADAFYEIAGMLGLSASPDSPKTVWERDMRPRLAATRALPDRETIAQIVARAYGGSLLPGLGAPGDYPTDDVDYRAADAILAFANGQGGGA